MSDYRVGHPLDDQRMTWFVFLFLMRESKKCDGKNWRMISKLQCGCSDLNNLKICQFCLSVPDFHTISKKWIWCQFGCSLDDVIYYCIFPASAREVKIVFMAVGLWGGMKVFLEALSCSGRNPECLCFSISVHCQI